MGERVLGPAMGGSPGGSYVAASRACGPWAGHRRGKEEMVWGEY